MVYTFCLIFIILYVFACMGMEMITTDMPRREDPEFDEYVERYFPNIPIIMLTLVQFVLVDSIAAVYRARLMTGGGYRLLASANFRGLVLVCINADFYNQILIF